MKKEEAQAIIQKAVLEIQDGCWTLTPVIQAQGNKAQAVNIITEMTATQHKQYLASKPPVVEKTKTIKE
jgi:hypothetical protein